MLTKPQRNLYSLKLVGECNKIGIKDYNQETHEFFVKDGYIDTYEVYTWVLSEFGEEFDG